MPDDTTGLIVNPLEHFNIVIREPPMFEYLPNPVLIDTGEGRLIITCGYDGNVGGVPVGAFRMIHME